MKYELDLSAVKNTGYPPEVLKFKIPCKIGLHQLNYDVIECEVPKDIYAELIRHKNYPGLQVFPVGFDDIPIGATLTRVE